MTFRNTFSLIAFLALIHPVFSQEPQRWSASLQGQIGYYLVPHQNSDDELQHQIAFEAGFDRHFGRYFTTGINLEFVRLADEQLKASGTYGNQQSEETSSRIVSGIVALKLAPSLRMPFGNSSFALRPMIGVASVNTTQKLTYDANDNGVLFNHTDVYDYDREWMAALGLSAEYALSFDQNWSAFASLAYEGLTTPRQAHTFDNTERRLEEFPQFMQYRVEELRTNQDAFVGRLHKFGDFAWLQLGVGLRYAW